MRESVTLYANFHMFRLTEKNYIYCNLIEIQRKRRNKRNNHRNEEDVSLLVVNLAETDESELDHQMWQKVCDGMGM